MKTYQILQLKLEKVDTETNTCDFRMRKIAEMYIPDIRLQYLYQYDTSSFSTEEILRKSLAETRFSFNHMIKRWRKYIGKYQKFGNVVIKFTGRAKNPNILSIAITDGKDVYVWFCHRFVKVANRKEAAYYLMWYGGIEWSHIRNKRNYNEDDMLKLYKKLEDKTREYIKTWRNNHIAT